MKAATKISFIVLSVAVSIVFLAVFLIPVLAPDIVQEKKYIGSDSIELGTKNETLGDFTVKFTHIESGISQQIFDISISNIKNEKQKNEKPLFLIEPFTYGTDKANFTVFELKNISRQIPHYDNILINETLWNATYDNSTENSSKIISNVSYIYSYYSQIQNGFDTVYENVFVPLNYNYSTKDSIKSKKYFESDFEKLETKYYQIVIPTPISLTDNSYGSSGILTVSIGGNTYYDTTNSSWWNSSYSYKKQINITAASTLPAGYTVNLTWDMTQANILNTGNDTRVVIDDGTNTLELDRNITNNGTANAILEFKLNSQITGGTSNTSYYIYYGNPSAGNPPNNKSKIYALQDDFDEHNKDGLFNYYTVGAGAAYSTFGGNLQLYLPTSANHIVVVNSTIRFTINSTVEFRMLETMPISTTWNWNTKGFSDINYANSAPSPNGANMAVQRRWATSYAPTVARNSDVETVGADQNGIDLTTYHIYGILWNSTAVQSSIDRKINQTVTSNIPTNPLPFAIRSNTHDASLASSAINLTVDWVVVRRWVSNPPTITLGAEELSNNPPQWSNNQSSIGALNALSNFNATWTDDSDANGYNFSFFELGFPNGTSNNYTAFRFPNNISHYNISIVSKGYHNFSFYANDSSKGWNKTSVWRFLTNANETTTNNATQTSWNETFTGNQNNTFWVNIPKYAQVIDAKLNLSGYEYSGNINITVNEHICVSYINSSDCPNSNLLWVGDNDGNNQEEKWTYLKFEINNYYTKIINSSLFLETASAFGGDTVDFQLFNTSNNWNETNLTWSNKLLPNVFIYSKLADLFGTSIRNNTNLTNIINYNLPKNISLIIKPNFTATDFVGSVRHDTQYYNRTSLDVKRPKLEISILSNISNPYLDVSQNGNKDWQFGGEFNQTNNRTTNFSSEIQSYLSTCTAKADGTCDIPFVLHSDTAGKIQISDISVLWYMGNRPPNWLANSTSKTSPQTYNPTNNYGFQINSSDADDNMNNTWFQLGRPIGTLTNYSALNDSASGADVWYYNLTQSALGGAGTYNYTWFLNDTDSNQNKTDTINYIINKQPISLSLLPTTQTITYETSITQYCSDNSTEYDCTIWKNDTNITVKNNTAEVYGFAVHFFKANVSAPLENYTWTEQNSTVTINQKTISIYLALNGTEANKNYNYPDVLNATAWKDTTLNNEGTLTLLENGTSKSNPRIWQPSAKTYNYSAYMTATNYSANSIQDRMAIYSKAPTLTKMFLNNSEANRNYEQGRTANFTATLNVSGKTVYITANMTGWVLQSGATPKTNTTKLSDVFTYNITGYFIEDENYTASQQSYFATVTAPLSISNPTPTRWFYDNQQKTDNFFTNLWNITNNSVNIANITFISENKSSGALQTYYNDFLTNAVAFNATNCNQTVIAGSSCSIFARYKNILSGSQTMNLTYNITYTDGEMIQNIISTSVSMTNETTTQNNSYINITLIKVNSTSASINSLNLKGISSTQALWLNATQNLDYEIGNPTSQTLTNINITLNVPYGYTVNKSQVISSLASGAKRNITFQVNTTDVQTFRGWGLDTFWIVANSTQNVDGANYNMFRLLVQKNITINIDIPGLKELGNTTAGTPITLTVNFTNNGAYSIFYPHIFLNLNGTFGFESGHITSKTSTDPTNTVCRTDLNKTVNPKASPINASRNIYSYYGWKGTTAETIRIVDLKPSIGILTPDWNESVTYDVKVNDIIIGSGTGSSPDSFIPTITASLLSDALSSIVLNQNNNISFRVTPNSVAPSGRYNVSYPVCYEGGISATNDIFSPPLAMKIFVQKDTSNAFRVPGYEDLVRTSTENIAPGGSSTTYAFSIIPPSVSETYTISAIVFDDTETGQWFEETKQLNALNTYPDKNIAVKDYDYNTSELVADAAANSPRFNMTRRMVVENRNLNNYSMIEWRTIFPGDASNISGTLSGVVENLCGNCITYPSNISFTLPGVSIWRGAINYDSSYTTVGSNITGTVTITQYNNASTQTWYDVKVNATSHIPANYSATSNLVWFISSLRPERQTTNSISITSLAPNETNWTIARNSTDYYIYNATIEVPNNNTKSREIRYVFDRSRLTDYSSDNLAYTVDGNSTNLSYSISASQFTLTIPTTFNNGQSLDYGNHTVIISYLMASTTVSVGGGGTVYAPAQCNIGYQLIGNICQPTDLGFTVKPDPIVVNISFAEWFSQQKQIEIINTVNRDINLSVETASADGSDKWVSFSAGFQNLKKVELITLNPKSSFSGGSAFLTYSINIPQNATGTYHTDIILKNLANGRSATVRMTINITEGKASVFNILAVMGIATAVFMAAAYLLNRRRKRKKQY